MRTRLEEGAFSERGVLRFGGIAVLCGCVWVGVLGEVENSGVVRLELDGRDGGTLGVSRWMSWWWFRVGGLGGGVNDRWVSWGTARGAFCVRV